MAQILVLLKYTVTWRMEVAMSILKHQKLITLFGLSLLMSLSSPAQAQWPTLDLTAIKEGISSKNRTGQTVQNRNRSHQTGRQNEQCHRRCQILRNQICR